jgi:response regulator RpfG family c-di-GMP phosphodiesterase
MNSDFLFDDDEDIIDSAATFASPAGADSAPSLRPRPWKVLVVDDEPEVHAMTAMVLADVRYKDAPVEMISAHSAAEARALLTTLPDIACILLDVVMETDDAGLTLVRYVRQELGNSNVRIILRTGQPGQAPERDVIVDYDINDYKAKTELTSQKLFTTMVATLRSYDDIMALEVSRSGLQKIIDASASLFQVRSMQTFSSGVLTQLSALLGGSVSGILCAQRGSLFNDSKACESEIFVLAGAGEYETCSRDGGACAVLPCPVQPLLNKVLGEKANIYADDHIALYIRTPNHREVAVYLHIDRPLRALDEKLVEVFCSKVSVGFDNIWLYEQLKKAHEATVVALADLAEYKNNDTGDHVLRVEQVTAETARKLRAMGHFSDKLDDIYLEQIGPAAILHDVGKVSTPDHILQKPGKLTPEEFAIMREHAETGGTILERAASLAEGSSYLSLGAEIAMSHHERWDGNGYPHGLSQEEIPLSARIVAVADVYDALISNRPYKDPWPLSEALDYIRKGAGQQFDPRVVEAFLAVIEDKMAV